MYSLAEISGLPMIFNEDKQQCGLGDGVMCASSRRVKLDELVPTLLNKSLRYPEHVYSYHESVIKSEHKEQGKWNADLRYDVYVLPFGLLGIEYIKTHIYYTQAVPNKVACIVEVLLGELTVVLQKNEPKAEFDFDTHVAEAVVVNVAAGKKALIPTGYMFTFVNASNSSVIFSIVRTGEHVVDYRSLNREQGLAYFLIAKNARAEVVTNPRYRTTPSVVTKDWGQLVSINIPDNSKPLYSIAIEAADDLMQILYHS
jgi:oxalate decarboxylase/phosphoglucose isomerase-like protein (cupin superfamily)